MLKNTEVTDEDKHPIETQLEHDLIAPCGMNCSLCIAYHFRELDINKQGFHRRYCPGCIPRAEHCKHMGDVCEKLGQGRVRFCTECEDYPCKRLKALDNRYRSKYHMSMLENLDYIEAQGMEAFLSKEADKWKCNKCGGKICCHNGLCLKCDLDKLLNNKKYRWNEHDKHVE